MSALQIAADLTASFNLIEIRMLPFCPAHASFSLNPVSWSVAFARPRAKTPREGCRRLFGFVHALLQIRTVTSAGGGKRVAQLRPYHGRPSAPLPAFHCE